MSSSISTRPRSGDAAPRIHRIRTGRTLVAAGAPGVAVTLQTSLQTLGAWLDLLTGASRRAIARRYPGVISGLFLAGYAVARLVGEIFREPDRHLGFIIGQSVTMGQLLSLPPLLFGGYLIWRALRRPPLPA